MENEIFANLPLHSPSLYSFYIVYFITKNHYTRLNVDLLTLYVSKWKHIMWGGVSSNFPEAEHHLLKAKLDLLFISETGIDTSIPVQELAIPGYSRLITKHDNKNCHVHRFSACIKVGFHETEAKKTRTLISCICVSACHLSTILLSFSLRMMGLWRSTSFYSPPIWIWCLCRFDFITVNYFYNYSTS